MLLLKALTVAFWLVLAVIGLRLWAVNRQLIRAWLRFQGEAWMAKSARERRVIVLSAVVVVGVFAAFTAVQDIKMRGGDDRVGSISAYWGGLRGDLSVEGAEAYSKYVEKFDEIDMGYHSLVSDGDLAELPPVVRMTPEQYLDRHSQFERTEAEEARWDPCFRAQVYGESLSASLSE